MDNINLAIQEYKLLRNKLERIVERGIDFNQHDIDTMLYERHIVAKLFLDTEDPATRHRAKVLIEDIEKEIKSILNL